MQNSRYTVFGLALGLTALSMTEVDAQDSHYFTSLYGARSTLMGGAVIASVDDPSGAFYNPGALADVDPENLFLGTKVFDWTRIILIGELDQSHRLETDDVGKAPSFAGGLVPIQTGRHRFAYSIFKRGSFKLRMTATTVGDASLLNNVSSARVNLILDGSLNEDWVGLSWAYGLDERTSIGISNFFSYRSHRYSSLRSIEGFKTDDAVATGMVTREFKYSYWSVLWKIGIKHELNEIVTFGVSFTTPSVRLPPVSLSDGKVGDSISLAGASNLEGDLVQDIFVADFQTKLEATYKSPWAVGLGGAYKFTKRSLHLSGELYGSVSPYRILDAAQFVGQSTGDTLSHAVVGGNAAVINLGFGYEEHVSKAVDLFLGLRTDLSYVPPDEPETVYVTHWNLYHLTGGTQIQLRGSHITLGLGWSFGNQETNRFFPGNDIIDDVIPGLDRTTRVKFRRLKIILGFGLQV